MPDCVLNKCTNPGYAKTYEVSWLAVFTYKIRRNDVGIMINNAVAIRPRILTSITFI